MSETKVETTYKVYRPGVKEPELGRVMMSKDPSGAELREFLLPILGNDCENFEHVYVFYNNKRADMFVDEVGALSFGSRPPLPVNHEATVIYYAASKARGQQVMPDGPKIHGVAVVFDRIVWR